MVVLSDYAKGAINPFTMAQVRKCSRFIIVNGKPSQIELYDGVNILTFNMKEFVECMRETGCSSGEHICGRYNIKYLVVTEGDKGMSLYTEKKKVSIPTIKVVPVDITGAGDTAVAILTYAMKRYNNIMKAIKLANKGASKVIQKSMTSFVTLEEIEEE
jgi:rfaE bifunctional protein kinase chain/domain